MSIENIKKGQGTVDFTFEGVKYRALTGNMDIFAQQDLMSLVEPATEGENINPISKEFSLAAREIMKHAAVKSGSHYTILDTHEEQKDFYSRDFAKTLPRPDGMGLVMHFNMAALFIYQMLVDEDWLPEQPKVEVKKKRTPKSSKSGANQEKQKATLSTTLK